MRKSNDQFWTKMIEEGTPSRIKSAKNFLLEEFWKIPFVHINDVKNPAEQKNERHQRHSKGQQKSFMPIRVQHELAAIYEAQRAREEAEEPSEEPDCGQEFGMEDETHFMLSKMDNAAFHGIRHRV